jgi:NAD+ synthase (glutamine-hydrolysing)
MIERQDQQLPFDSPYRHGFVRAAVATPGVRVAAPAFNGCQTLDLAREASAAYAAIVVFPELGLSAYSNDDLFFQDALLDGVEQALAVLLEATRDLVPMVVVGAPLRSEEKLFNCAVVLHRGQVLGIVPKCYLPNYREFYEPRQFASARTALQPTLRLLGREVPFGTDLIFETAGLGLKLHVEVCEDLWVPIPPSTLATLAGATVLANLSASNVTIGKPDYRRLLCESQSAKCLAAYLYAGAGPGESTTDLAWDGHALIYENGQLLAEGERYPKRPRLVIADIDLEHLEQERRRMTSFRDCAEANRAALAGFRRIPIELNAPREAVPLLRSVPRFPYVPSTLRPATGAAAKPATSRSRAWPRGCGRRGWRAPSSASPAASIPRRLSSSCVPPSIGWDCRAAISWV